jgi:hypothetical protein
MIRRAERAQPFERLGPSPENATNRIEAVGSGDDEHRAAKPGPINGLGRALENREWNGTFPLATHRRGDGKRKSDGKRGNSADVHRSLLS